MRMTVKNNADGPRGIRPVRGGLTILDPGQSYTGEFDDAEAIQALDHPDLECTDLSESAPGTVPPNAAADLLRQADDLPFMSLKHKAREILGDDAPSKKAEIIVALERKAAE